MFFVIAIIEMHLKSVTFPPDRSSQLKSSLISSWLSAVLLNVDFVFSSLNMWLYKLLVVTLGYLEP